MILTYPAINFLISAFDFPFTSITIILNVCVSSTPSNSEDLPTAISPSEVTPHNRFFSFRIKG